MARNRERPSAEEDVVIMNEILGELPSRDREVLAGYYVDRQSHEEIVAALGIDPDYFQELKAIVRREFFKRTGRGS
jgi:DNA-directed RNA polymerase specialized sigma24 family protein